MKTGAIRALLTGASGGIGRALAVELHRRGQQACAVRGRFGLQSFIQVHSQGVPLSRQEASASV